MILMESCSEGELLDSDLHSNMLLIRLFHEEGVRVFEPIHVMKSCRCTAEKVRSILSMMPIEDLDYMETDGEILMRCEFCSHEYSYPRDEFKTAKSKSDETDS